MYLSILPELNKISPDNLIRVHENDFLHVKWEQHVQEQNFVSPNCSTDD